MEYQDFTIDIESVEGGGFEAKVAEAPIRDNPRLTFPEPIARADIEPLQKAFDRPGSELKLPGPPPGVDPTKLGGAVQAALLAGDLGELFRRCRDLLPSGGEKGLRVRLRFRTDDPQAAYLAAIPWEWLWDAAVGKYLAIDRATPLVREIASREIRSELGIELPLRILVVDAAPAAAHELQLKLEIERMTEALASQIAAGEVELLRPAAPTKEAMRDALLDDSIHVLHFMGHGGYDPSSGTGAIFLEKPDGTKDQVDGQVLADYLKRSNLRLVVLNACKTARFKDKLGSPLNHGVAPAILEQTGIPAVVANQYSISDQAAIAFSSAFYGRIAKGDGVDEAITEARLRLKGESCEWATPVLFLTAPHGRLFGLKRGQVKASVQVAVPRPEVSPVRLGVRSIDGWGRDMKERNDQLLELGSYFDGRYIKNESLWQEKVFPDLRNFLKQYVVEGRPLALDFAAHSSIAFAAGWLLEPKSGLDVRVRQRTGGETELDWYPKDGSEPGERSGSTARTSSSIPRARTLRWR